MEGFLTLIYLLGIILAIMWLVVPIWIYDIYKNIRILKKQLHTTNQYLSEIASATSATKTPE